MGDVAWALLLALSLASFFPGRHLAGYELRPADGCHIGHEDAPPKLQLRVPVPWSMRARPVRHKALALGTVDWCGPGWPARWTRVGSATLSFFVDDAFRTLRRS